MKVISGRNIPRRLFRQIVELDAEVFTEGGENFTGDTTMPKQTILSLIEKGIDTTSVVVDELNNVVGFYINFAFTKEFEKRYLEGSVSFKDIDESKLVDCLSQDKINLYLFSIGIKESLREKKVMSGNRLVPIVQLLHEGLIDCLVDLKHRGVTVKNIFGEGVSDKGVKLVKNFCGEDSLIHADDKNKFYVYGSKFNPNCKAFSKCRNVDKLIAAYAKQDEKGK